MLQGATREGVPMAELARRLDMIRDLGHDPQVFVASAERDGYITARQGDALLSAARR